jgi:uncharacterized protein
MNRRQFLKSSTALGLACLIGSYPVFMERYFLQVNRYRVPIPRLPDPFHGFTIVQLTDLHYGFLEPLSFLEQVVEKTNSLKKDVVVCTGDYVLKRGGGAEKNRKIEKIWPVLSELNAPLGVYSVLGNHDHWVDTARSVYSLERSGQDLRHRTHCFEREGKRLWLGGGGDLENDHRSFDTLLQNVPPEDCRIILAHNPDSADTEFSAPMDLMISGHTHGGQICIPFLGPPYLPVKNKNYSSGLKASRKGQPVFISKGIGWAIYPVRFNCPPEIAVLELVRAGREDV